MNNVNQSSGALTATEYNRQQTIQWGKDYDASPGYHNKPQLALYLFLNQRTQEPLKSGYVAWRGTRSVWAKTKAEALAKLDPEPQPVVAQEPAYEVPACVGAGTVRTARAARGRKPSYRQQRKSRNQQQRASRKANRR